MKLSKEELDKLTFKEAIAFSMAYIMLIAGLVMIFTGMMLEPRGQIHESVLVAFGIILSFVGAIMGISIHAADQVGQIRATIPGLIRDILPTVLPQQHTPDTNIAAKPPEPTGVKKEELRVES